MERMDNVEEVGNGRLRKWVIMTVTKGYRSVWNHPFLVFTLYLLFLLYRSFPFLFSTLVSISPVLVCTGVLLGTLLSFGRPNKPEIEDSYSFSHVTSLKASSNAEDAIVSHDRGEKHDVVEEFIDKATIPQDRSCVSEKDDVVFDNTNMPMSIASCCKILCGEEDDECMKKGSPHMEVEKKREVWMRKFSIECGVMGSYEGCRGDCSWPKEVDNDDLQIHRDSVGPINSIDAKMKSPLPFEWKEDNYAASIEEDDDDGFQSLDIDPEKGPCSPRNPLKDNVFHMLDGSHPFPEKEAPLLAQPSSSDFDFSSKHFHEIENDLKDANEDRVILGQKDNGENNDAGRKTEEELKEGKDSDITWTQEDQNNLMDLGISEIERNCRLESLIARRRARKRLGLMAEINLIDLDGPDLPLNVPAIATTRCNPFDGPDDYYASMGLPPIPGSAPSVLLLRRNPFDLPYEPDEEKPDLKRDSFQREFSFHQQKDMLFSRHASFNVKHMSLDYKQEKQDSKWRPYFVSEVEQVGLEESSNRLVLRQIIGTSDSKLSSIPDTESIISNEEDDKRFSIQECYQETEVISNGQPALLIEHENESSKGMVYEDTEGEDEGAIPHDGAVITLGEMEIENLMESTLTKAKAAVFPLDMIMDNFPVRTTSSIEEECNSMSSSSSFSEVNGVVLNVKNDAMSNLNTKTDMTTEKNLRMENPSEVSDFGFPALTTVAIKQKEAIYDSSPESVDKLLSHSSISSDNLTETFAMMSPIEPDDGPQDIEKDEPNHEEMFAAFSTIEGDGSGSRSKEVREVKEATSYDIRSLEVKETFDSYHDFSVPESVVKHKQIGSTSCSTITESGEGHAISKDLFEHGYFDRQSSHLESLNETTKLEEQSMWKEGIFGFIEDQVQPLSYDTNTNAEILHDYEGKFLSSHSTNQFVPLEEQLKIKKPHLESENAEVDQEDQKRWLHQVEALEDVKTTTTTPFSIHVFWDDTFSDLSPSVQVSSSDPPLNPECASATFQLSSKDDTIGTILLGYNKVTGQDAFSAETLAFGIQTRDTKRDALEDEKEISMI